MIPSPLSNLSFVSSRRETRSEQIQFAYADLSSLSQRINRFHSAQTPITVLHGDIVRAVNSKQLSMLERIDFSLAFDTVDHKILVERITRKILRTRDC